MGTADSLCGRHGFVVERIRMGAGPVEAVQGVPDRLLAGHVLGYRGYRNARGGAAWLRLVPSTQVKLDLSLDTRPRLDGSGAVPAGAVYGLRTRPGELARPDGQGVLVTLSPPGAYALLGVPLWEVTDGVIDVADVVGRRAGHLLERLAETPNWRARLALLDDVLTGAAAAGPRPAPQVVWAWQRLCLSGGRVPVADLADEIGWTRRHLLTRFREQIGISPKMAARVIRFQRALQLLQQPGRRPPVAAVAQATGYSDQSHLTREFRTLTGRTPVELTAFSSH